MNISPESTTLGIVGAGTMGSGIALAALYQGYRVILQDSFPGALEKAREYIETFLAKKGLSENAGKVTYAPDPAALAPADIVIEAIIEDLAAKQDLFRALDGICPPPAILASNTSTLAVTAVASVLADPGRAAGMHFFNPAPLLPLVEVVRAAQSRDDAVQSLVALAESLGKTPVVTGDTPGFIVNRVARPYYGEALRLLGEGAASLEAIDLLAEQSAGFRMGPFRLMDLIGIDINATAMQSMYEQTFGEPRYRPHPIQIQKMQAGMLGRKTGRGFYAYSEEGQRELPQPPAPTLQGAVFISEGSWAPGLKEYLEGIGVQADVVTPPGMPPQAAFVAAGRDEFLVEHMNVYLAGTRAELPVFVQCVDMTLAELAAQADEPERLVGFDGLFFAGGKAVTLVASPALGDEFRATAEETIRALGKIPVWVRDSPGLVLPRIVFQLVNEAAFAVLEGVADADTIDLAMRLGVNYPKGPLAWGREFGYSKALAVLDHLYGEYREDRYRACVLLRRWARLEKLA
ncbi:MAG: 3-hydroxyacyl-CoA dehydrogenase [Chloroflexi bacterium]|nr:3-hydroxyacyl-CoA dehydrogenase [Chloroflexota bacterium]